MEFYSKANDISPIQTPGSLLTELSRLLLTKFSNGCSSVSDSGSSVGASTEEMFFVGVLSKVQRLGFANFIF